MRILVTGSSGLVGTAVTHRMESLGHEIIPARRTRTAAAPGGLPWDPEAGIDEPADAIDAVVHLAGENIAGRWTGAKKERIRTSRVAATERLATSIASWKRPPQAFVAASAIGFYGDRGDEALTETSTRGEGFLADVCNDWEDAADPLRQAGVRVAHLRFGVVLAAEGGALKKMLLPFKLGAGGRIGDGRQFMSWITLEDAAGVVRHALENDDLSGPINAVTSAPVTNAEFTRVLAKVLRRPAVLPMPAFMARLVFGEMAEALLLASARVIPERLDSSGFRFVHPDLERGIQGILGRVRS